MLYSRSIFVIYFIYRASLIVQSVYNLPAMQETWVQLLGWEDPLEKETATHSNILALGNPMDRGAWQARVHRFAENTVLYNAT